MELSSDIRYLKGVGEKRAAAYHKLGIFTVEDLLYHFPRAYEDRSKIKQIFETLDGETVCIKATVSSAITEKFIRKGMTLYTMTVSDGSGSVELVWFNMRFVKTAFRRGETYYFYGKMDHLRGRRRMSSPVYERAEGAQLMGRIVPVYPLSAGLTQKLVQTAIAAAIAQVADGLLDPMPAALREAYRLPALGQALRAIHFPDSPAAYQAARRRFVFEELLVLQTGLAQIRARREALPGIPFADLAEDLALPFPMTGAQARALSDIKRDLARSVPMNRLVQGDVGCGKTAVAACALFLAARNGVQGAMMAPTEILAEQHFESLAQLLAPYGIRVVLLSGSLPARQKRDALEHIALGTAQVVVGTHALLSEGVSFRRLGLVVTDEQHRFGVAQRRVLAQKGENPHVLVMTATPIPRTLSLMVYGDLDVSVIDELPPGRQTVDTFCVTEEMRPRIERFIAKHVDAGRQVYVVCPLVEEGESGNVRSAEAHAAELRKVFPRYRIGLLHGRMRPAEKDAVMGAFAAGEMDILVATSVIEVGVNVPNAVLMVVENAERFGLSQLHQLRGRVGRGSEKSYCILFNQSALAESRARMEVLCRTNDGFQIAEKDLELRGPGEFFGARQHGLPPLRIANIFTDAAIIGEAKRCAEQILAEDPGLSSEAYRFLAQKIRGLFDRNITFN